MNSNIANPFLAAAPVRVARMHARASVNNTWFNAGIFYAAHIPLALLMFRFDEIATAHALLTVVIGTVWVLSKRHLERAAYVGAYIVGAEVLWRMTDAHVFWEFGKYSAVALFITGLLRAGRTRWAILPLIYFLLLLPSTFMTFERFSLEYARKSLSFNLSGPFALMVSVWFFSNLKLSLGQIHRVFLALTGPAVGIASITAFTTFSASAIRFSDQSNKLTSGGFGPNQVSAILGLGVLLAVFFLMDSKTEFPFKVLMFATMTLLGVQSAMTFSRGGLYMAAASAVLGSLYLIKNTDSRIRLILVVTAILVVTNYVLLPYLDTFTGGALSTRFENTDPSRRDEIILADLQIWSENPIFGVGPGRGMLFRFKYVGWVAAHTEFTRLLAEHGIFGAISLLLLLIMAVQAIRRSNTIIGKALAASTIGWSFLFMMIDGMRLMAPAFVFGLSYAAIGLKAGLRSIPARSTLNKGMPLGSGRLGRRARPFQPAQVSDRRIAWGGTASGRR